MEVIVPNLGEFIPALIAFLIILFILGRFAWPTITGNLDRRAATIRDSLEKAEEAQIEAERMLEEYKQQMAEARKEAATVLQQARSAAEATRAEMMGKAQADADKMIAQATEAIEAEKHAAIAELQHAVAHLSVEVAGKIIDQELSYEEHLDVIEKYVAEAGSLNAN